MTRKSSKKIIGKNQKSKHKSRDGLWKWWKENKKPKGKDNRMWRTLEHSGPLFAKEYKRLPTTVKFYYNGIPMTLSKEAEEVAGFYGKMLKDNYTKKKVFNTNFFRDFRKVMKPRERAKIVDFRKCDFSDFYNYFVEKAKRKRNEKKSCKEELLDRYRYCLVDGKVQKVANFRMEPPSLFRGRGNHPKMGKLKKRIQPEDVVINIGQCDPIPKPPSGHKWKEVVHNNKVSWLAKWQENIFNSTKYMLLHPSSKLKGENDIQKYEIARKLKRRLHNIRSKYIKDLRSPDECERQIAVVLYFIDKLALRTGYEKDDGTADTVGCCSLRVQHIRLSQRYKGQKYVIHLDFPGKDVVRYRRSLPVHPLIYKNLQNFLKRKNSQSLVFDTLNPTMLNKYLSNLMENLTVKVFRTCHASIALEDQLRKTTKTMSLEEKLQVYSMANRSAAILCNHHRAVPKTFNKSLRNIQKKMKSKIQEIRKLQKETSKLMESPTEETKVISKKLRRIKLLKLQVEKLNLQITIKLQTKDISLTTTKLNYLDPRITAAWCKKWDVDVKRVFNKTTRERFQWAIETTDANFKF